MTLTQIKQRYQIVGNCREINTAVEIALQVAPTDVTVLVYGENGTGKEVFSRIIHDNSKRKHKNFIPINTGAIPEGTLDSELFGHERGAFTSAIETRKGYFEEVEGGTIFLDEIGEMPLATQARLLRLLENGEYLRVGSSKIRRSDVRVVAATNRDLLEMIRGARFRKDLYFRLNTVSVKVPPLRERGDDIELLFTYFAHEFGDKYQRDPIELHPDAIPLLYQYRWPGNVRELKNLVEKLTLLIRGNMVSAEELQQNLLIRDSYVPTVIPLNGKEADPTAGPEGRKELDILYKLIYDLGKEVSDLKKVIFLGMQGREVEPTNGVPAAATVTQPYQQEYITNEYGQPMQPVKKSQPLLEESLSLEKKEKELIIKALNKHGNNRKKAASELGISERTLYRKIKNYDIDM
ncbi:MAG: sigma 54-interacting transcriptional regulator [Bacteroidota bacterium]